MFVIFYLLGKLKQKVYGNGSHTLGALLIETWNVLPEITEVEFKHLLQNLYCEMCLDVGGYHFL